MDDEEGVVCWRCREADVAREASERPQERPRAAPVGVTAGKPADGDVAGWVRECRRIIKEAKRVKERR